MPKLNYIALDDHSGYGIAAAEYMRHLRRAGYDVAYQPLRPGCGLGLWYECAPRHASTGPLHPEADTVLHVVPEYYPALVRWLRAAGVHGRVIAYTTWEASRLQEHWPALLNAMDAVIVPSAWNHDTFVSSGVTAPVYVLPHISEFHGHFPDVERAPDAIASLDLAGSRTIFYSIATQMHRKGNDLLLAAFELAFPERRDVRLLLKTSARDLEPSGSRVGRWLRRVFAWDALTRAAAQDDRILLMREPLSSDGIAMLHAIGDCYVTCTRGEGWGIGLYEAMLFGKPALAPALGGHLAFFRPGSPNLVRSKLVAAPGKNASDGKASPQVFWVETDVEAMAQRMREIDAHPELWKAEAARTAAEMRARFHPEALARQFTAILKQIETAGTGSESSADA